MKFSKVVSQCKAAKTAAIYQRIDMNGKGYGTQWISAGAGLYCMEGMPQIRTKEELFSLWDVKESQRPSWIVNFHPRTPSELLDLKRWSEGTEATLANTALKTEAGLLRLVRCGGEYAVIHDSFLEPFRGGEAVNYIEYAVRKDAKGNPYLVVFDGMETAAVLPTMRVKDGNFLTDLMTDLGCWLDEFQLEWNRVYQRQEPEADSGGDSDDREEQIEIRADSPGDSGE